MSSYKVNEREIIITIDNKFDNVTINSFLDYYKINKSKKYIYRNNIFVNNKLVSLDYVLKANDKLKIVFLKENIDITPSGILPNVVYEDEFVLIVSKEHGKLIYSEDNNNLSNDVAYYFLVNNINQPVRPIHRLDVETSGLLIYSKIPFFQPYFDYLLKEKMINRIYHTIVTGKVNFNKRDIFVKISKDRHSSKQLVTNTGKDSLTHVKRVDLKNNYSFLEVTLSTGRTHQIRVSLKSIGYPIVGDSLYNDKKRENCEMRLHAHKIKFKNVITDEEIEVEDTFFSLVDVWKGI